MKKNSKPLHSFLKNLRLKKNLDIKECAKKIGLHYTYLGQLENGKRNFNYQIKHYVKLKNLLCDSPEDVRQFDILGKYQCRICETIYENPLRDIYCQSCNSKRDIFMKNIMKIKNSLQEFQVKNYVDSEINSDHLKMLRKLIFKYRLDRYSPSKVLYSLVI